MRKISSKTKGYGLPVSYSFASNALDRTAHHEGLRRMREANEGEDRKERRPVLGCPQK